jgi:ABC-type transport system substrate-binding protein
MTRMRRSLAMTIALALMAIVALAGVAGVADAQESEAPKTESTFRWGDTSEPSSLNPIKGYLGTDYTFWAVNYNLPIEFAAADFGPDLEHSIVTSVDTSDDGMTFTYHMRDGMKWSDGEPFTADDVAWTLNWYKKQDFSNYSADVALIDTVTAPDATTFEIQSTRPTSFYAGDAVFLYDYILPKHIWSQWEDDPKGARQFANVPSVGSGPYVITAYEKGQSVTLERNPNYWGTAIGLTPHYDKLVYIIYNNEDAEAAALQRGEIDFAYIDSSNILNNLQAKPNIQTRGGLIPLFDEIGFNTGSAYQDDPTGGFAKHGDGSHALTDPVVRRAIRQAIDNQTLIDRVKLGYGVVADSPVQPTASTGNWDPSPEQELPFDIDAANASLDDAGYTRGSDGIRVDPFDNKPLKLRYYVQNDDQNTIEVAPFVSDWLEQIGIETKVIPVSSTKLGNIILNGTYDMFHWGWYPNPDPNYILGVFTCGQRPPKPGVYDNNDSYYCNPEYDKLFDEQQSATTLEERSDIVHQMQEILYEDAPYAMLFYTELLDAYRSDRVTGFTPQPADQGDVKGDLLATWGPFSFISIQPASEAALTPPTSGVSAGIWIGIGAAIVVIAGVVLMRRRRHVEDEDRA